jgi:hypothetical protein
MWVWLWVAELWRRRTYQWDGLFVTMWRIFGLGHGVINISVTSITWANPIKVRFCQRWSLFIWNTRLSEIILFVKEEIEPRFVDVVPEHSSKRWACTSRSETGGAWKCGGSKTSWFWVRILLKRFGEKLHQKPFWDQIMFYNELKNDKIPKRSWISRILCKYYLDFEKRDP